MGNTSSEPQIDSFSGDVISKTHSEYDLHRKVWNRTIDKKPTVILRCKDSNDVAKAIQFARTNSLQTTVRGGGHSIVGYAVADDAVMIDLSLMRSVTVNPEKKTAYAQGGALLGDLDRACQIHGLGVPSGLISETGLGGITLGGGLGWLTRSYGLTSDCLISVDLIDVNGNSLKASKDENSDLFWALQGGGGNFGIVTGIKICVVSVEARVRVPVASDIAQVLEMYKEYSASAPRNLSAFLWISFDRVLIMVVYLGNEGETTQTKYERALELVSKLRYGSVEPMYVMETPMKYADLQKLFDKGNTHGNYYWSKSTYLNTVSNDVIDVLVDMAKTKPKDTTIEILHLGGALGDKKPEDSAFFHRNIGYEVHSISKWEKGSIDIFRNWSRKFADNLKPVSGVTGGYVNFNLESEDPGNQFGSNYERLREIKKKYDPENFFRHNHNILPM